MLRNTYISNTKRACVAVMSSYTGFNDCVVLWLSITIHTKWTWFHPKNSQKVLEQKYSSPKHFGTASTTITLCNAVGFLVPNFSAISFLSVTINTLPPRIGNFASECILTAVCTNLLAHWHLHICCCQLLYTANNQLPEVEMCSFW